MVCADASTQFARIYYGHKFYPGMHLAGYDIVIRRPATRLAQHTARIYIHQTRCLSGTRQTSLR